MTTKKYEILRDQTIEHEGRTLYRIRRLSDGKIGGWIEKEENLSQEGECFVYENAKVYWGAKVFDNAQVYGDAEVEGNARVYGNAQIFASGMVYGDAQVYGNAKVCGEANVDDGARVYGDAEVWAGEVGWDSVVTVDIVFKNMPKDDITVTDHHIGVGCETHTFEHWEKHIEYIGKKHNYSDERIALYKETIFGLIAQRRAQGF